MSVRQGQTESTGPGESCDGSQWIVDPRPALGAFRQRQLSFDAPEEWAHIDSSPLFYMPEAYADLSELEVFPDSWIDEEDLRRAANAQWDQATS